MKKILLSIACLVGYVFPIQAQALYGTTGNGGSDGGGTINKFQPATNNLIVARSFESLAGAAPNFIQAKNGKLYGMSGSGGSSNAGVIFSFDPASKTYTKLQDFDTINGAKNGAIPDGGLLQARDGKLYGMTTRGGSNNAGVIFSFHPSSLKYEKLKDFDNTNGGAPTGSLIQATDGKLYGVTSRGGSSDAGVIFSFEPKSSTYTKLKDFDILNGGFGGGLVQATDGKLYGVTGGGTSGNGVIFSFDPSSSTYRKLKDFDYSDGSNPISSLIQATDGKLYGMAAQGGNNGDPRGYGVLFSFDPSTETYTKLKDFDGINGARPLGSLVQASDGKLYGTTQLGGISFNGVIFSFDPSSSTYTKLKDFDRINGAIPFGSLVQASDGKLYGMTEAGGSSTVGVIFSFATLSSTYTVLKDLGTNPNGSFASGSLTQATDGKMYGMTTSGGGNGVGVIFSFEPSSSNYTKLKDFDNTNGGNPQGSLMQASDGKLYGMTYNGGALGFGVIFSFDPSSSTYTKLKDFDYLNGGGPYGSLMQATDGKLYGTTSNGGFYGNGVIFSFDPSSSIYTKLKDFDYNDGKDPKGHLIQATDGKLYGVAGIGGSGPQVGVIFSFDPSSSTYTKLKDFDYLNGASPYGSLVQATDRKLYGMTSRGGNNNYGVIFSFDPSTSAYTKLKDFDYTNGGAPTGSLMQATDGKLYGMTDQGGTSGFGVIFSFDPSSSIYTKLQDYNGANGGAPGTDFSFIEESTQPLLRISDATVYEAAGSVTLTVTLSKETDQGVSVNYKTVNGTAKIPFDYTKEKGTVTIQAGSQSASISIPVISDNVVEPAEQLYVELDKPVNSAIGKSTGTVTILDGAPLNSAIVKTNNEEQVATRFALKASPNPSSSQFLLKIESNNSNELLSLRVVDVLGKMVDERNNIFPGQTLQIGNNYKPGVYLVVLTQGNNKKQVKLIKL